MESIPSFQQRAAFWSTVQPTRVAGPFPAVVNYTSRLSPLYANGRVTHGAFSFRADPVLDWYLSRNQVHDLGFFEKFWAVSAVRDLLPYDLRDLNFFDRKVFTETSPFLLGGGLAWILSSGGAYSQFPVRGVEAKRYGEEAAVEMLAGSYDDTLVYECHSAWSQFFFDVAWDHTYVAIQKSTRQVHCLLATDTD